MCSELPENVLLAPHFCSVHGLQRVLAATLDMKSLAGIIYAVHMVTRSPRHALALASAAKQIVDEELIVIHSEPPEEITKRVQQIVHHTVLRNADNTQGSLVKLPFHP